jgi:uncharacterized protein YhaN
VRLDSIDLIRYGHFSSRRVEFPAKQPDFYVIYGDNEAGKSTLLRGISALLFGVPAKTPDTHTFKGSELRIGATISDRGNNFSFRRRKGVSGTVLSPEEAQIPEDTLASFFRELDRDRFEQFFGLNHARLREGGEELLRGQGDVGNALFQAAGLLALRRLLEKLDDDAKDLFSPKSRTKTISRVIEEYKQAKAEVRKLAMPAATAKDKKIELENAQERLAKLKEESHSLQQELVRLRRIESNKPDLARLHDLRATLLALESVPTLPPTSGKQHNEAVAALANADNQIATLTQEIEQREKKIQELPSNGLFKAYEKEIEELNTAANGYGQNISDREKRKHERDEAITLAANAWKEIWSQPVTEAESLRSVYSGKEEILELVAEHQGLTVAVSSAEEELHNVTEQQQRLEEQLAGGADAPNPTGLLAAIEHTKSLGDTDSLSLKLRSEIERFTQNAKREMRKLAEWPGSIEELENLRTPLLATIELYSREWERLAADRRGIEMQREATLQTIRQKDGELARQVSQVSSAGENELAGARARRDQLWDLIRASACEKTLPPEEAARHAGIPSALADTFAVHLAQADKIADVRFANAKEVVIHDRLVKEIAAARDEQQRTEKEIEQLENRARELRERWSHEWPGLGATPRQPTEMKEWLQSRQAVLDQFALSRDKEAELQLLEERARSAAAQICAEWSALEPGIHRESQSSLPVLLKMAQDFAREREQERGDRAGIRRQLKLLSVEKRRTKLAECNQRLSVWEQKWCPHVKALRLAEASTPSRVARALVVLEKVFHQLDKASSLEYRIKRIGDNIEAFETRVTQLADALDPSCRSIPSDLAIIQLHAQLAELNKAEGQRRTLQDEIARDREMFAGWSEKAQQASYTLEKLQALAKCSEEQLETTIIASEQKLNKKEEYQRIAEGLIERNASANLDSIEQEAAAYELDSLRSEIATKAGRYNDSVEEISQAAGTHTQLKIEFEHLEGSEVSALQAQKAEDALAQLRPAVEQYLRLRLAAEVLEKAIESYREKHQGPILTRASELFSRLTLGGHSGLTSDFGDDDKPVLVAIRQNGKRVHVGGLSEGTRDQLYFALRLAAIEDHVQRFAPCPVVLDDLLINSDDKRASAALQVIAELAVRTQVLFFTHHQRLADLGLKAGAQIIELGWSAATATA